MSVLTSSLPRYPARAFRWKARFPAWVGTTEASDLGITANMIADRHWYGQVYDDACDIGFVIEGRGENVVFVLWAEDRHEDYLTGVRAWTFRSINKHGRSDDRFEVTIFND